MDEQEILHHLEGLNPEQQREVLDFAEFLQQKHRVPSLPPPQHSPSISKTRILEWAERLRAQGGPQIGTLIDQLGGPRQSPPGWDSTTFLRTDREKR